MSDRRNRHFIHSHHHTRACGQPPAHRALRIALETTLGVLGITLWLLILLFLWTATPAFACNTPHIGCLGDSTPQPTPIIVTTGQ
jgi:hypothetical protein